VKTIRDIKTLRDYMRGWRQDRDTIGLVPTMGSLHRGHMSLVELAQEYAERIVVSVFVNPTQFGPNEDFEAYPRALDKDRRRLSRAGVDVLFAPSGEEIYPFGEDRMTAVSVPDISTILCGDDRPGHFEGVTSVVCRLFNIVQPDIAIFGQKDYQQLVIIRRMVADLHLPVKVVAGQTHREHDGLASSSRNRHLTDEQRAIAPNLYTAISQCRDRILAGENDFAGLEADGLKQLKGAGFATDYFVVRKAGDLSVAGPDSRYLVIMVAGRIREARLIDNVIVEREEQ